MADFWEWAILSPTHIGRLQATGIPPPPVRRGVKRNPPKTRSLDQAHAGAAETIGGEEDDAGTPERLDEEDDPALAASTDDRRQGRRPGIGPAWRPCYCNRPLAPKL